MYPVPSCPVTYQQNTSTEYPSPNITSQSTDHLGNKQEAVLRQTKVLSIPPYSASTFSAHTFTCRLSHLSHTPYSLSIPLNSCTRPLYKDLSTNHNGLRAPFHFPRCVCSPVFPCCSCGSPVCTGSWSEVQFYWWEP
jgi:hypothetical protein